MIALAFFSDVNQPETILQEFYNAFGGRMLVEDGQCLIILDDRHVRKSVELLEAGGQFPLTGIPLHSLRVVCIDWEVVQRTSISR